MKRFSNKFKLKGTQQVFALSALLCFMLISSFGFAQQPTDLFEKGNQQYANGNYQEAVNSYEEVAKQGYESAALYFNLANAQYKLNRIAPSVYYYEKALKLDPKNKDIQNNLTFAKNMTIDAITPLPQNTFKKWYNSILSLFTIDGWAVVTVILVFVFVFAFIGYYFTVRTGMKRLLFTTSFVALGLAVISLAISFQARSFDRNNRPAIVWSPEAEVKSEPNLRSDQTFLLHEGTKVHVLEETDDWKRIRIADGKEGWVTNTEIKEL